MTVDFTAVVPNFPPEGIVEASTLDIVEEVDNGVVYGDEPFYKQG